MSSSSDWVEAEAGAGVDAGFTPRRPDWADIESENAAITKRLKSSLFIDVGWNAATTTWEFEWSYFQQFRDILYGAGCPLKPVGRLISMGKPVRI